MNELLISTATELAGWLANKLPLLDDEWWDKHVLARLTFQQARVASERRFERLSQFDLSALLRILDQNWHELAAATALPRDARTLVREMQAIRNRWAHLPGSGITAADRYRDLDTLSRLLAALGVDGPLLRRVGETLDAALQDIDRKPATPRHVRSPPALQPFSAEGAAKFSLGQVVCLRSNPAIQLPVLQVSPSGNEPRYIVFENGSRQTYYESQLCAVEDKSPDAPTVSAPELSACLSAIQLSSPSVSALYSLNAGRVRFVPYQYRPVFKLVRADRPRILIADEVGVGKTIEAGIILKELQARSDIKSVLIVCPKPLVDERKWEMEMKRFGETFVPLDGPALRHCIAETHLEGEWPSPYAKAIVPFSLFDSDLLLGRQRKGQAPERGLLQLDPPPKFDLIIVDEAHNIRNSSTYLHQAVRYFADNAEAVVFLSATPVQLGSEDLYTLLNVLRPDVVIDSGSFAQMAEPNHFINQAIRACRRGSANWAETVRECLRHVAATAWGREVLSVNPGFQHIYDQLAEDAGAAVARIKTIQALEELYTFSAMINRTKRRDIGEFTTRKPETLPIDFTPVQKELHDRVLTVIAKVLARMHGNHNVKFMMTTVSRQAASSLYALAPTLRDMLAGRMDALEASQAGDESGNSFEAQFIDEVREEMRALVDLAEKLDEQDPKAEAFVGLIQQKLEMEKNKALVFSTFRHTLAYLRRRLEAADVRVGLVHGGIVEEERREIRRRFALAKNNAGAIDVLLSSEIGCEGLDFQFCDCLVNYDLPWNPMRIEQRIGRLDRYGQESEAVAIFNLITPGTIDAQIYNRCLLRIGVFNHAIGENEEILGEITRELHTLADSYNLSETEREAKLQQIADNKIRQLEEEQRLEERQGELFGLHLAAATWEKRLQDSRNYWLEPASLTCAVEVYLRRRLGKEQEFVLGEKALKTLRLSQEGREKLLEDFRRLPRSNDVATRAWETWLRGSSATLSITFEQESALENPGAELISLGHPLIRQAAGLLRPAEPVQVALQLRSDDFPAGVHPFAVYAWSFQGVKQDERLVAFCTPDALSSRLLELLPTAQDASLPFPGSEVWDRLDQIQHRQWSEAAARHAEENRQLVGVRIQSLRASHQAREVLLHQQLHAATNAKIRVMKQAELDRARYDFERRLSSLETAAASGDLKTRPVVLGVFEIKGNR